MYKYMVVFQVCQAAGLNDQTFQDSKHNFHFLSLFLCVSLVRSSCLFHHLSPTLSFRPSVWLLSTSWLLSVFLHVFIWYISAFLYALLSSFHPLFYNYSSLGPPSCPAKSLLCSGFSSRLSLLWFKGLFKCKWYNRTRAMFTTLTIAFEIQTENSTVLLQKNARVYVDGGMLLQVLVRL